MQFNFSLVAQRKVTKESAPRTPTEILFVAHVNASRADKIAALQTDSLLKKSTGLFLNARFCTFRGEASAPSSGLFLGPPLGVRGFSAGSIFVGRRFASTVKRHSFQKQKLLPLKVKQPASRKENPVWKIVFRKVTALLQKEPGWECRIKLLLHNLLHNFFHTSI